MLIACSIFDFPPKTAVLAVMIKINSCSRRQEYSKRLSS